VTLFWRSVDLEIMKIDDYKLLLGIVSIVNRLIVEMSSPFGLPKG
jgi:hypothetical protein